MSSIATQNNKQLVAAYLNAISGRPKTPESLAPYVSDASLIEHIQQVEQSFPAYELAAVEIIAERDLVAVRGTVRGVHRGPFAGIEPTGKSVSAGLIIIYRIADGRIAQYWLQFDLFGLLQQLRA